MSASTTRELEDLVKRREVVWSVFPETLEQGRYDIELNGRFAHAAHDPRPSCPECREVYDDLCSIAQFVIPKVRATESQVHAFDGKLSFSPRRGRKEITLTIRVRGPCARESENECLMEMERRLERLGARRE